MLASFFNMGSFSYTLVMLSSFFIGGVSLTHPVLASFLSGRFVLHIPCWFFFHFYLGSFSYTSHAGLIFMGGGGGGGVSLTHPMLASFLSGEFLLHIPWLASFLSGQFLLHIPC